MAFKLQLVSCTQAPQHKENCPFPQELKVPENLPETNQLLPNTHLCIQVKEVYLNAQEGERTMHSTGEQMERVPSVKKRPGRGFCQGAGLGLPANLLAPPTEGPPGTQNHSLQHLPQQASTHHSNTQPGLPGSPFSPVSFDHSTHHLCKAAQSNFIQRNDAPNLRRGWPH